MPPEKLDVEIRFFTNTTVRDRLKQHAKRIGMNMSDIARDGLLLRLDQLDAQVANRSLVKVQIKKALLPDLKEHSHDSPKGLGEQMANPHIAPKVKVPDALQPVKTLTDLEGKEDVPAKIKKSFKRYAKYIDEAKDDAEKESRAKFVAEEIAERLDGDETKTRACIVAFAAFMEGRAEAKATAPGSPPKIDDSADVVGDVDDD
jgi:hypothetical protein